MNIQEWSQNRKKSNTSQPVSTSLPSLDLAFDLVKEEMQGQLSRTDGLDTKVSFIIGRATGLVGVALTLQSAFLSSQSHSYCTSFIPVMLRMFPQLVKRALPIVPLLLTSSIVTLLSYRAYKIRNYYSIPVNPEALYMYLEQDVVITKIDIYERMRIQFKENARKLDEKARCLQLALLWLGLESFFFIVLLLYQSIC